MLLYLDDDSVHGVLVKLLRKAGHDVCIPNDVGLYGADDPVHFAHAIAGGRALLTYNHNDFKQLHDLIEVADGHHFGVIAIRRDNDGRDLKPNGIASALANFALSGHPLVGQYVVLNHYR